MKLTIVYNSKSGSSLDAKAIRSLCAKHDVAIDKLIAIGPNLKKDLAAAIKNGATIAAIGGDGTVSAVAGIVAGTKATLLPLPGGTLNNFTKTLNMPQDVEEALAQAITSKPKRIDIASVNGTYFINNSSIGLYPRSLRQREQFEDAIGKWPAAALGIFKSLFRFHSYRVSVGDQEFKTPFVFVGNNDYNLEAGAGTVRERLDEGVLSIYIVKSSRRFDLVKIFFASLFHRLDTLDSFDYRKTKKLTINTKKVRAVSVSHDGEVTKISTPLTYEIHAKALRVLM